LDCCKRSTATGEFAAIDGGAQEISVWATIRRRHGNKPVKLGTFTSKLGTPCSKLGTSRQKLRLSIKKLGYTPAEQQSLRLELGSSCPELGVPR